MTDPYVLGIYAYKVEHDFKTALVLMEEANQRDPSNALVYVGWSSILSDERDYDGGNREVSAGARARSQK